MALENAQWIDELVIANPTATDVIGQGDDHLRMLKVIFTNTFVGAGGDVWDSTGGALLKGPAYLNSLPEALDGVTAGDFTINGKGTFNSLDILVGPSTFAGEIQLENVVALTGRNFADDADIELVKVDANDAVIVGEVGFDTVLIGDLVTINTGLKQLNDIAASGRNFADDGYIEMIKVNVNDEVEVGEATSDTIIHGVEVTMPDGNLTVTGDLTYTGTLNGALVIPTLANEVALQGRNAANDGDIELIQANAADDVEVGQAGRETILLGDTARSVSPFEVPAYTTANLPNPALFTEGALAFDTDTDELKVVSLGVWKAVSLGSDPGALTLDPVIKTAAFVAVAGFSYLLDTTGGSFIITLPAGPAVSNRVGYIDYNRNFATANAVLTSGENIEGDPSDYEMDINAASGVMRYVDVTQGWLDTGGMA